MEVNGIIIHQSNNGLKLYFSSAFVVYTFFCNRVDVWNGAFNFNLDSNKTELWLFYNSYTNNFSFKYNNVTSNICNSIQLLTFKPGLEFFCDDWFNCIPWLEFSVSDLQTREFDNIRFSYLSAIFKQWQLFLEHSISLESDVLKSVFKKVSVNGNVASSEESESVLPPISLLGIEDLDNYSIAPNNQFFIFKNTLISMMTFYSFKCALAFPWLTNFFSISCSNLNFFFVFSSFIQILIRCFCEFIYEKSRIDMLLKYEIIS